MSSGTLQPTTHHLRSCTNSDQGLPYHANKKTIERDTKDIFRLIYNKTYCAVLTAMENLESPETVMCLFDKSEFQDLARFIGKIATLVASTYAKTIARANVMEGDIKIKQNEIQELVNQTLQKAIEDHGASLASTPSDNTHQKEDR